MLPVLNTQTIGIPSSIPTAASPLTINKLPDQLMKTILNFLSIKETFYKVHSVQRSWRQLTRNDGHLSLSHLKIKDGTLWHIIYKHENCKLRSLDISHCKEITNRGLIPLSKLKSLTHLDLARCSNITKEGVKFLSPLVNLSRLSLQWLDDITGVNLSHLSKLPLTSLSLNSCKNLDSIQFLSELPLRYLDLSFTGISDSALAHLARLPLKYLDVRHCNLTDSCLDSLLQMPLVRLDLDGCRGITHSNPSLAIPILGYYFQQSAFLGRTIPVSNFSLQTPELYQLIIEYMETPELRGRIMSQDLEGL